MKIRSITYFCNPGWPIDPLIIQKAGQFLAEAKAAFEAAGFVVQSTRLATLPFPKILGKDRLAELPRLAEQMEATTQSAGIPYAALGPALPEMPESFDILPEAIAATQNVFFSAKMADARSGISLAAIRACADVIVRSSTIDPNGFANLRFAALANVKPGSPFFPAAYHDGDKPAFALGTEAADLAVEAFSHALTIKDGKREMVSKVNNLARILSGVNEALAHRFSVSFGGIDFSLAPFPSEAVSIGAAFERMGVPKAGLHGSLAAAAILTEALESASFSRTGFNGLMLPVLEDAVLASRAAEGILTVKDLLLYSAVCGTGVDTLPLPGDTTADQIVPLLLDLSALALRLNKPLTARLMPIPGKKAGDMTNFSFDYFANSRVMSLEAEPLNPPFSNTAQFTLDSRHS